MFPKIKIKESKSVDIEEGFLIDGFPSVGFSSAIATESMVHASQFEQIGVIDSDSFPSISVINDGKPSYPTRIFVNQELKTGIFLSYLTLDKSLHRVTSRAMLRWAKDHKIKVIISSVAMKSNDSADEIMGIGNTDSARAKINESGMKVLEHGTVSGIPGMLLNEGSLIGQDVIVIVFQTEGEGPDFQSSLQLCSAISKLIPGASCNIPLLQKEAEKAQGIIAEADEETKHLRDSMYR